MFCLLHLPQQARIARALLSLVQPSFLHSSTIQFVEPCVDVSRNDVTMRKQFADNFSFRFGQNLLTDTEIRRDLVSKDITVLELSTAFFSARIHDYRRAPTCDHS